MQAHSQFLGGGGGTLESSPSPTSHSGQWQKRDKRPPPGVLGPSIPFWAAVTSSCFRFCTVSQSGEEKRRGEDGFPGAATHPHPTCQLGMEALGIPCGRCGKV